MAYSLILLLLLLAAPAGAAGLPDPTRPALSEAQEAAEGAVAASGPRLTMVRIGAKRRMAVIDGQEVTVGSRINDMRVVRIGEEGVVLKGPAGTEVLKLLPEVEKRSLPTPQGRKPGDKPASRKTRP
jgi:hypothetical protein